MKSIVLATEDVLSEEAGLRLAAEAGLRVEQQLRRSGNGYLKSRIPNFCEMAAFRTVVVISDLDQIQCPSKLLADWLGPRSKPDNLLLRVAVREIESWLLADRKDPINHVVPKLVDRADAPSQLRRVAADGGRDGNEVRRFDGG